MSLSSRLFNKLVALQHRDFRLLWAGQAVSVVGSQMQLLAINWHIYQLLRGSAAQITLFGHVFHLDAGALGLGGLGLVRTIPIVLFALLGGLLADTQNRRVLLIWAQGLSILVAFALAIITFQGWASLAAIYLLTAASTALSTMTAPAQQSLIPNLVPREHFTNAVSLNAVLGQIGRITGPAIAGVLVSKVDIGWVYAINGATYLAVVVALLRMDYRGRAAAPNVGLGWAALQEGVRFTYRSKIIWSTMLLDFFATFFSSARTMLPIIADQILGVGVRGYGFLATAQPIGALIAGLFLSFRREIYQQGKVLLISVAVYGAATALFGLSTWFALSYFLFALTGASDTVSMVIRGTIRQIMTPDSLRGRMVSVNMIFFMGGPQLGELEAGAVAALLGVPFAIMSGGLATVLLVLWTARRYPSLRRYTSELVAGAPAR
jgi:MFS family permease